jgi:hypothetical protein
VIFLTLQQFKEIDKTNKIFIFSIPTCGLCQQQKTVMEEFSDCYFVETADEEFLMNMNIQFAPYTVLYGRDNEIMYRKYGVFAELQKKHLREKYAEIDHT